MLPDKQNSPSQLLLREYKHEWNYVKNFSKANSPRPVALYSWDYSHQTKENNTAQYRIRHDVCDLNNYFLKSIWLYLDPCYNVYGSCSALQI